MMDLENMLAQPMLEALGWGLIHFIWQGTLVALLLAGVLRLLQGASTNARYATACAALLLMLIAPLSTIAIIGSAAPRNAANGLSPVSAPQPESQFLAVEIEQVSNPTQSANLSAPRYWSSFWSVGLVSSLPWMILLWLVGVVFFALRLIGGWHYARRLRSNGARSLEEQWRQVLNQLCRQLRVKRPVRLLESALVKVPMVIGWLRPVILIPASALSGLTPQQLEAIIAHELAHIRRHDYLVNLLQAVVETLLFYHPAVWWVSRRIRQEREHCCDDLAVAVCGDAIAYARALLEMERIRVAGPRLALAANGGLLMNRIQRLVGAQPRHPNRFTGWAAGVIALFTLISAGAVAQILLRSSDQQIISSRKKEIRQVDASDAISSESDSARARQPVASAQDDRAAEALLSTLQSPSWDIRKAAVESLAQVRGDRAVELLIVALKDENTQVREQAVIGLGIREDGRLAETLIAALADRDWQVREQAAIALGKLSDELAVEPLIKALQDSEWAVREQAARALGASGLERAVEPLINSLRDTSEDVREAAAKSLGVIGDGRALEPLNQALRDSDEQVRKKAAEALGLLKRSGGESSMSPMRKPFGEQGQVTPEQESRRISAAENLRALSSSNPMERAAAACSLGKLEAVEAIPSLINMLGDETPIQPLKCWESGGWSPARHIFKQASPGEEAAIALASFSRVAVAPLIDALGNGNSTVRRNAAWAIGEIRGGRGTDRSAAVEPLIAALNDEDAWVRRAAAFSLGEMRPRGATEALIATLGDTEWSVREMAAWAIGEMKSLRGAENLTALLLRDENERVRRKAAWALGEIRDPRSLDALNTALNDQDQGVRATVKWAISEIRD